MRTSESINEIAAALAKAQGEFPEFGKEREAKIVSKRTGQEFSYHYTTLGTVYTDGSVLKILAANGLAIVQPLGLDNVLTTMLCHASGQWIEDSARIPISGEADARTFGSAISYWRRFCAFAILGIAPIDEEDDDADAASKAPRKEKAPEKVQHEETKAAPTQDHLALRKLLTDAVIPKETFQAWCLERLEIADARITDLNPTQIQVIARMVQEEMAGQRSLRESMAAEEAADHGPS